MDLYLPPKNIPLHSLKTALVVCQPCTAPLIQDTLSRYTCHVVLVVYNSVDALEITQNIQPDVLLFEERLLEQERDEATLSALLHVNEDGERVLPLVVSTPSLEQGQGFVYWPLVEIEHRAEHRYN